MFTRADFITDISQSLDFVNVQDWSGVIAKTNPSSTIYSVNGLGCSTATSTGVVAAVCGSADQRVQVDEDLVPRPSWAPSERDRSPNRGRVTAFVTYG